MVAKCLQGLDLWYSYDGGRNWAVRNASLAVEAGTIIALTGPNGAGKTTLLKLLGLIYRPQQGRVLVDGVDYWTQPSLELRRRIVYVHEEPVMLKGSVLDNIAYGLLLRGLDASRARKAAEEAAEKLGLTRYLEEPATKLSTGLRQLVAIARAVAVNPSYLLLDEPFAHLDRAKRSLLARVLEELRDNGVGIVVAGHVVPEELHVDHTVEVVEGSPRNPQPANCISGEARQQG